MKVFQTPLLRNFQINPALLGKPQTLPFDMPADKKEKIINLLLWGMNAHHPDFLALDYKEIKSAAGNRHLKRIKGITVDKSTLLSISVRSDAELRSALKAGRRIPSLMMVIDILDPEVPASRRWLFQLKNEAVDAIRKTIYEDKRIDETLLDSSAFDFALKNFEDPIDTTQFLDLVISARSDGKEIEEAIDEAFIVMVSDKMSVLESNQVKILLSLVVTDRVSDIRKLTTLSEEESCEAIDELQMQGLVHSRGEAPVLPLYLKNLKKPGLLIGVMERMIGKMEMGEFGEIEEFYFRILKEIKPKGETIEQPVMRAETMRAISYPFQEMEELDTRVLSLEAPFMGEVAEEIKNSDRLIEMVDEVLFKTIDDQIRGIALSVRALAYMKKGCLEESRRDIDAAYDISPEVLNLLVPFYLSYGNLYQERVKYKESVECYDRALKLAEESGDKLGTSHVLIGIAEVHLEQAKYAEAEELVRDGLKIAEGLGESGKSVVARALDLRGTIRHAIGNAKQAIEYYEQALSIYTEVHGKRHPDVASTLNNIGGAWHDLGEHKKAIKYYEQALSIGRNVYSEKHPAVAKYLNNIGAAWLQLGDPRKAMEYSEQALSINREACGDRHPDVATYLNNIGGAWHDLGEHKKAIKYYEQALLSDVEVYGERHPDVATDLNNMGIAWNAMGDSRRAKTYLQQAYSIFQEFYGDEHPSTRQAKESLDALNK
ncbi:MAG: Photosystem I assembly protein Ycf3 [Candidatus Methanogaster sp.]|nr:MAG: Photosystem I assembly protein Ycf3 [ANME-2 cluster archaeon]